MDVIYAQLIIKGLKTISDVPEIIKADVKRVLAAMDRPELAQE